MGMYITPNPPYYPFLVMNLSLLNTKEHNQQYGLQTAFSEIERLHFEVTDGGNPIGLDLRTRYVVKGIGKEQTIDSKVLIFYDKVSGKITRVEDKWNGQLPDSWFQNVSLSMLSRPRWWLHYSEGWAWYLWSLTWDMWWWQVCVAYEWSPVFLSEAVFFSVSLNFRSLRRRPDLDYLLIMPPLMLLGVLESYG